MRIGARERERECGGLSIFSHSAKAPGSCPEPWPGLVWSVTGHRQSLGRLTGREDLNEDLQTPAGIPFRTGGFNWNLYLQNRGGGGQSGRCPDRTCLSPDLQTRYRHHGPGERENLYNFFCVPPPTPHRQPVPGFHFMAVVVVVTADLTFPTALQRAPPAQTQQRVKNPERNASQPPQR